MKRIFYFITVDGTTTTFLHIENIEAYAKALDESLDEIKNNIGDILSILNKKINKPRILARGNSNAETPIN